MTPWFLDKSAALTAVVVMPFVLIILLIMLVVEYINLPWRK